MSLFNDKMFKMNTGEDLKGIEKLASLKIGENDKILVKPEELSPKLKKRMGITKPKE
jgi:hypothetical protein